jgi:hypothetical protein
LLLLVSIFWGPGALAACSGSFAALQKLTETDGGKKRIAPAAVLAEVDGMRYWGERNDRC